MPIRERSFPASPGFDFGRLGVQPKLTIGRTDDPQEREADRAAETVMRLPHGAPPARASSSSRAAGGGGVPAPPAVHDVLASPGQPLDAQTRAFFEPRFGHDFSGVRVHSDRRAADSATAMSARAYAAGRDIIFAKGEYTPGSSSGRQLIAHELAHVAQQAGSPSTIRRKTGGPGSDAKGDPQNETAQAAKQFDEWVAELKKKTNYGAVEKGKEFSPEAILDSAELMEKLTKPVEKYLRSDQGREVLESFANQPKGHALRLFARDWGAYEHSRRRVQRVLGKRLGGFLYDQARRATMPGRVADIVGDAAGDVIEKTQPPSSNTPVATVEGVKDGIKDMLKDSSVANSMTVKGQNALFTPAVTAVISEVALLAIDRPDGRKAIQDFVTEHKWKVPYKKGEAEAGAAITLAGDKRGLGVFSGEKDVYSMEADVAFPKGGDTESELKFDRDPQGGKNKFGFGIDLKLTGTEFKEFSSYLSFNRNNNVAATANYQMNRAEGTQQVAGSFLAQKEKQQIGYFANTKATFGATNQFDAGAGFLSGSKDKLQTFIGAGAEWGKSGSLTPYWFMGVKNGNLGFEIRTNWPGGVQMNLLIFPKWGRK
ncbi:MAG TPA: DUF4157 domain-containing protein [Rhizomicrobium sp.]|nr:DUF4157 domain-containing protein [Rhizomicrobium sp.]